MICIYNIFITFFLLILKLIYITFIIFYEAFIEAKNEYIRQLTHDFES